jgi:eukaryotic-like serine/threonine-protein kinase
MPLCPACSADIAETAEICPRCSAPTPWSTDITRLAGIPHGAGDDANRADSARTHLSGATTHRRTMTSGSWLTTTDAIDHGRFPPGTILDDRYRIVGRLGKGGMGEVYRADDLKLGQPVALKFLPESVDRDPARLTQLHTEVRMARQVAHPNVCRVYDVGEYDGHTFLSMEYVDGEDLASLLRRIGRFPEDRAIEVARQICAGLAAAHDRGVVHRDLKPANVMLDGSGRIRITDFGLAGVAGETLRAGTPAYMAPEQIAGGDVTPRSDLYSLGLVLYELFTGRRALEGRNLAELIAMREQAGMTQPSSIVRDLDPAIDRAIMRCLEPDPAQRPASALAVAASLPGGDPLAAALAAGETPSPEMVAAAGATSALQPLQAIAGLVAAVAALLLCVVLADRILITSMVPLPKPPLLLADRASQILSSIGYGPGVDSALGFVPANFLGYMAKRPELGGRAQLATGRPAALHFWYRSSPTVMVPTGDLDRVTLDEPALAVSGMTTVVLDPEGRLIRFAAVPPQLDPGAKPAPVAWKPLFDAAEIDPAAFTPAEPEWTPLNFADTRVAWTGSQPGLPGQPLRIEAGAYRGKPVYFYQIAAWTPPSRMPSTIAERGRISWASALATLAIFSMFVAAALIARHNLRKGRGDRRGAFQLAAFVSVVAFGVWLLNAKHVADPNTEMGRFFTGQPLWAAGLLWVLYLAVEPYVRRFWPSTVVSWSRLMARQWRDPLVGRDILFGIALGALIRVIGLASTVLAHRLGQPAPPDVPSLEELLGTRFVLAQVGNQVFNAVLNALFVVFGMVLLKIIVRREWAAVTVAIALFTFTTSRSIGDSPAWFISLAAVVLFIAVIVLTVKYLGLLSTLMLFLVDFIISNTPFTLDVSRWFFADSLIALLIPLAMAAYGFYVSRGGEPLFGRRLLD